MDLGTHSHRRQPDVLGKLRVESVLPLDYILADTKASWARLEIQSVPDKADQFDLVVGRRELLKLGSHKLEIGLTPVRPTREKLGDKVIEAVVEIVSDVQPLPSGLFFGVKDPGGWGEQVVKLHSLTQSPFTIASYRVEGAEAQILPLADNSGPAFRITVRTAHTGQQQGRCVFVARHQDGEEYEVVVPISYYGTAIVSPGE